jgi:hypothetical protein
MDTVMMVLLFAMFCLMLAFLAVFARSETALLLVKTLTHVIARLFRHYLP